MVKLGDLNMRPDSHPDPTIGCSHRFTGIVEKGDLQKFDIVEESQTITVVCLDSPGGSFAEAVKIAEHLKKKTIGTKLEAGARCESACSIMFMAGSYWAHEVGPLQWRIMHPTAKLGFHVPALSVAEGTYNKQSVETAYNLAMRSVSEIIFKLVSTEGFEAGDSMRASLLGHMMSTPYSQMFYVDTVDEAGRWGIMVGPTRELETVSKEQIYLGCQNIRKWEKDESAIGAGKADGLSNWVRTEQKHGQFRYTAIVDEFHGIECTFLSEQDPPTTRKSLQLEASVGSSFLYHDIYMGTFMPPETRLSVLAPEGSNKGTVPGGPAATHICAVMQQDFVVETNSCSVAEKQSRGRRVRVFTWASGSKTVLIDQGSRVSVNGAKAVRPRSVNGFRCYLNTKSNNQFCMRLNEG